MTDNPLVSIIIPTYNRAHLIGETLDSVLEQTYENWECIIIDDGSTDQTVEVVNGYLEEDNRFQYHHRPKNKQKGANACRNYGFELCKGKYVNWFDDDDIMHPNKLIIQVKDIDNSNYNFSVCQTLVFENTIKNLIGMRSKEIYSENVFYDYLTQKIVWLTPSALWKKSFLKKFEYLFDEELQAAQEWEFHCRVLLFCSDYHVINDALIYIRQHENSVTYNSDEKKRTWNYFLARNKLYKRCKSKLKRGEVEFLQDYLLKNFKKYVRSHDLNYSFKSFYLYAFLEKEFNIKQKFYAFIWMLSYLMTAKGDVFQNKVKYIR